METVSSYELVEEYATQIEPLLLLAQKAYGSRERIGVAHDASRKYTELLTEFQERGGSLPLLAKKLSVNYSGMRRRVAMRNTFASSLKIKSNKKSLEEIEASLARVLLAKSLSTDDYHNQLADEYRLGIPLSVLARHLGLSSAAPLYYGVQRSIQRNTR